MITRVFVQDRGNGRLGPEERDLLAGLRQRGIPAELPVHRSDPRPL